jgi:lipopolysaccharide/colanic/teichoic acid biosynthesis glycosyltransferase
VTYRIYKRFFDISFSILGIIIASPILVVAIICLLFSGESSPIYVSYRVGKGGNLFRMFKLRTMRSNNSKNSSPLTGYNDNRVSSLGRFLRFSKIDELPQFFNILNGDLSFVGPRPMLPEVFMFYSEPIQEKLNRIRPGVTGIGSIVFRNEGSLFKGLKVSYEEFYKDQIAPVKADLETWYTKNMSFKTDVKILIFTVVAVLYGQVKSVEKRFENLPSTEIESI